MPNPILFPQHFISQGNPGLNLIWYCPGCHTIHIVSPMKHNWNQSFDSPTFTPSLLCEGPIHNPPRCHSYITNGKIKFLSDCGHSLAGVDLVPMVPIPDRWLELYSN